MPQSPKDPRGRRAAGKRARSTDLPEPPPGGPDRRRSTRLQAPSYLAVTVNESKVRMLRAVPDVWVPRSEAEAALGYSGKVLTERLHELIALRLLDEREVGEDRRSREYRRIPAGAALVNYLCPHVLTARARLCSAGAHREKLFDESIADRWDRMVCRVVLQHPQRFTELQGLTDTLAQNWPFLGTGLSAGSLDRRLKRLRRLGMIVDRPSSRPGGPEYVPGPDLWLTARLSVAASLWATIHTPERSLPLAGDLLGLVAMVRERIRLDPDLPQRSVVLHVQAPAAAHVWSNVAICPEDGRARLLQGIPTKPAAVVQASIPTWDEALLSGRLAALTVDGDGQLGNAIVGGITAALPPE